MLNNQEYITSKLEEILHEILPISSKRLKNLIAIIKGNKSFEHIKQGEIS